MYWKSTWILYWKLPQIQFFILAYCTNKRIDMEFKHYKTFSTVVTTKPDDISSHGEDLMVNAVDPDAKIGRFPYENENLIEGVRRLVQGLWDTNKELVQNENFPMVQNCDKCPDFDICITVGKKERRCFR